MNTQNRLYNEYGASNTKYASDIDDILTPAMNEIVKYCENNNVDLRDTLGFCNLIATNIIGEAVLRRAFKMKKAKDSL